jgi:hypothetical protein
MGGDFDRELIDLYEASAGDQELLEEERYSGESLIGEGAVKRVYRAWDNHCDRYVAIARLKEVEKDSRKVIAFLHEVKISAALQHPNIVRVYDVDLEAGEPYFTMELIEGMTLKEWMRERGAVSTPLMKLGLFEELCSAVAYAHTQGVLHLDLKPENIHIGEYGKLTLSDWSISHVMHPDYSGDPWRSHHKEGYLRGTPGFMAPEQIGGMHQTEQTDVYGLGAVLLYLYTGSGVSEDGATGLTSVDEKVCPSAVRSIIEKCVQGEAEARYASVSELLGDVDRYKNGYSPSAEEASFFRLIQLFARRHRAMCAVVLGFVSALVGVSWIYLLETKEEARIARAAQVEAELSEQAMAVAKQQAEQSEKDLRHANQLAEERLVKFQKEQQRRESAGMQLRHMSKEKSPLDYLHAFEFEKASIVGRLRYIDQASRQNASQLALSYFVRQKFALSIPLYKKANDEGEKDLLEVAEKWRDLDGLMPIASFVELIESLPPEREYERQLMAHFYIKKVGDRAIVPIYQSFLKRENGLKELKIKWSRKKQVLDLSKNPNLRTVYSTPETPLGRVSILSAYALKRLMLQETGVRNYVEIERDLKCVVER